jgi:hypothetical protein
MEPVAQLEDRGDALRDPLCGDVHAQQAAAQHASARGGPLFAAEDSAADQEGTAFVFSPLFHLSSSSQSSSKSSSTQLTHPLTPPHTHTQVVPYEPVPCKQCGGVLNPYASVDYYAKVWICPFCYSRNHFPAHYQVRGAALGAVGGGSVVARVRYCGGCGDHREGREVEERARALSAAGRAGKLANVVGLGNAFTWLPLPPTNLTKHT